MIFRVKERDRSKQVDRKRVRVCVKEGKEGREKKRACEKTEREKEVDSVPESKKRINRERK